MKTKENNGMSFGRKMLQRVGYALGGFGGQFPKTLVDTFTSVFLVTAAGIDAVHVAALLMVTEIIDAISDYLMGIAIDATKCKFGRNRLWMLIAIPVTVVGLIALFSTPFSSSYAMKIVWAFVAYVMVTTGQTMVSVASNAIVPFLSFEPKERGLLVSLKLMLSMVGSMAITGVVSNIVNITGGSEAVGGYTKAAVAIGVIFAVITAFSVATLKEKNYEGVVKADKPKSNAWKDIVLLAKSKNYMICLIIGFCAMLVNIAMTNGAPYYAGYVLGNDRMTGSILMPIMGGSLVPMLLMSFLAKRFKKKQIITAGAIGGIVFNIAILLAGSNGMLLSVFSLLEGISFGFAYVSFFVMQPDIVDEVAYKTGRVISGLQAALAGFASNLGSACAMSMVAWLIGIAGFEAEAAVQSDAVLLAIRVGTFIIPTIAMAVILIVVRFYDLDDHYAEIRAALGDKKSEPEA